MGRSGETCVGGIGIVAPLGAGALGEVCFAISTYCFWRGGGLGGRVLLWR